jgi:peroxiredoxin
VLGVSTDSPFSQAKWLESVGFKTKETRVEAAGGGLPGLILLSDRNAELVKAYGIETYDIEGGVYSSRATFVIDKQGVLRYVNYEYKVKEDYQPLMKVLAELD